MDPTSMMWIITQVAEKHGCKILDVDLEKQLVNLDGPEENKIACALALSEVLG
jgi:hypothetical protein